MFRYLSSYFLILSCLSHLLCCGIPFFLGLTTFATTVGLSSLFFSILHGLKILKSLFFIITTVVILLFGATEINSRKLDCYNNGFCSHPPCEPRKKIVRYNLYISLIICCINFSIFFVEQIFE